MEHQKIAERIRFYRKVRGWSQTQLAEQLLTTQCVISNTENAKKGSWIDSLDKLSLIAKALRVDFTTLIFGGAMMRNYKDVSMDSKSSFVIYKFDDLVISVQIGGNEVEIKHELKEAFGDDELEDGEFEVFCLMAMIDNVTVGLINGVFTDVYKVLMNPWVIFWWLDSEYEIYSDELLAFIDKILPQESVEEDYLREKFDFSDEDIDRLFEKVERVKNKIIAKVDDNDDFYSKNTVLFLDDVIVNPDYRKNGILTKMMDALADLFGDFAGAAYIYPVCIIDDDRGRRVADDDDNVEDGLQRNYSICEKMGWVLTDDFCPSATERNSYALKIPKYILEIAKLGEEFRQYIPHEIEEPQRLRGKMHGLWYTGSDCET